MTPSMIVRCRLLLACSVVFAAWTVAGAIPEAKTVPRKDVEPVVQLENYRVNGNPVEDFGFRVSPVIEPGEGGKFFFADFRPVVDLVIPNTAASKAGIRPGDRIISADGKSTVSNRTLSKWRSLQQKKWEEAREAGVDALTWTLVLEDVNTGTERTVVLRLPTPAPRWGGPVWQAPEGRVTAPVTEAGPLAERAQQVLDNGIWMILRRRYVDGLGLETATRYTLLLGYQWTLWDERGGHRLFVSQYAGRTDVVLEFIDEPNHRVSGGSAPTASPDPTLASERTTLGSKARAYLTAPDGRLQRAYDLWKNQELLPAEAKEGWDAEVDFWLGRVGKFSARWPLEVLPAPAVAKR